MILLLTSEFPKASINPIGALEAKKNSLKQQQKSGNQNRICEWNWCLENILGMSWAKLNYISKFCKFGFDCAGSMEMVLININNGRFEHFSKLLKIMLVGLYVFILFWCFSYFMLWYNLKFGYFAIIIRFYLFIFNIYF